jgi:hypothetical protein
MIDMITPQDVKDYSVFDAVQNRSTTQLEYDILQAKEEVFKYCGHDFTDPEYVTLPQSVTLALIKLTEYFTLINSDDSIIKGYTSETLGDYSYSLSDSGKKVSLNLSSLLDKHVKSTGKNGITFKMRSL